VVLQRFLAGAEKAGAKAETVYLKDKNIKHCLGCFACWTKTPGKCVHRDDMDEILPKVMDADVIVYATPLYTGTMMSHLKKTTERLIPLLTPYLVKHGGTSIHDKRYDKNQKTVLVSVCGFPELEHFDALRATVKYIADNVGAPLAGEILRPGAEPLTHGGERLYKGFLEAAEQAGVEVALDGKVSAATKKKLDKKLMPHVIFRKMANIYWKKQVKKK